MDYEKKYKDALEWARKVMQGKVGFVLDEVLEKFPELKESEDEKIRGKVIATIHLYYGEPLEDEAKEMIAWLEKQGEHAKFRDSIQVGDKVTRNRDGMLINLSQLKRVAKPAENKGEHDMGISEATKQKLEDNLNRALEKETSESCNEFLEKQSEQKSDTDFSDLRTWKYIVDAVLTEKEGIGQYLDSPVTEEVAKKLQKRFGNVEQKPVEDVNGEDYGIDGLYVAMDILNKTLGQVEGYQSDDGILEHKAAMTAVKKLYKQKPVELEKEEKSRLMKKCVHRAYQQGYDTGFYMATTELEHKQEWSEEDEKFLGYAIKAVHNMYVGKDKSSTTDIYTKTANWLNSLRPQNWKPSKEQMNTLEYYMHTLVCNEYKEILFGLYADLKKLMEE